MQKISSVIVKRTRMYNLVYLLRGNPNCEVEIKEVRGHIGESPLCSVCNEEVSNEDPGVVIRYGSENLRRTEFIDGRCYKKVLEGDFDYLLR